MSSKFTKVTDPNHDIRGGYGRAYNYSSGPAMMPFEVMEQFQKEFMNWDGSGVGCAELVHRGPGFAKMYADCIEKTRKFLEVPDEFEIIFFAAGASNQMTATIYNLLKEGGTANYCPSGWWSQKSVTEARKFMEPNLTIDCPACGPVTIPPESEWKVNPDASYTYFVENETINGTEFLEFPFHLFPKDQIIVADMSSSLGSKKVDWSKYGVVFSSSGKNFGPSGVCVTIIRKDLIGKHAKNTPMGCDWELGRDNFLHTTPPIMPIYLISLNVEYMIAQGGIEFYHERNEQKAKLFYDYIDSTNGYFVNTVDKKFRSRMNISFTVQGCNDKSTKFANYAQENGFLELLGHASSGGCRLSIYNPHDLNSVKAVIAFMTEYQKNNEEARKD